MEWYGGSRLAEEIRAGRISSVQATEFFIARIDALDAATNLVVIKMWDSARKRAAEADAVL